MINRAFLIGNVGKDPESKTFDSGAMVATFQMATNRSFMKDGEWEQHTEWHTIKAWGKDGGGLAGYVMNKIKKGMQIHVQGEIRYTTSESDGVKKYYTDIVADTIRILEKTGNGNSALSRETEPDASEKGSNDDNDLPF